MGLLTKFFPQLSAKPAVAAAPEKIPEGQVMQDQDCDQFRLIYENAPDAVIMINSKGFIVRWNPAAEKMFGWTESEVLGKVLNEVIVPDEFRQGYIEEVKKFLKTGHSDVLNSTTMLRVLRKNQSSFIVDFTVAPVQVNDDYMFLGFSRDATERRRGEQKLKESEERYRLLTTEVKDYSIIMLSPEGNISSWNDGAERINGYSQEEIIDQHFSIFYPPEAVEKGLPMTELAIAKENGRFESDAWKIKKDGSAFWANLVVTPLKRSGQVIGFSAITRDNTERRKAEEEIIQLNTSLERRVIERTEELQQSEKKYRKLFQNSPLPMWVLDLSSWKFIDVNEAAIAHYGYSREEFLSMNALDIRPEDEQRRFLGLDWLSPYGIRHTGIWKHLKKDGSIIYVDVNSHELNIGELKARLVLSVDITEKKKAEDRLELALEAGQIGTWEMDLVNDTSIRNLRHDQIFGYDQLQPEWGSKNLLAQVHPDDLEAVQQSFGEALKNGVWSMETRIVWLDGTIHWILVTGKVPGDLAKPTKMQGTVIDITRQKQAEEDIRQLNSELEQRVQARTRELHSANKELESFSYSVSHDLRAPLRAIHSYSQILQDTYNNKLDEDGNKILNRVLFNSKKMERLIHYLLEFSKLGKATLHKTEVDVNKIVRDVVVELSHSSKYPQNIVVGEMGMAVADEVTLQLVFQNLLVNAVKYSSKKEDPLVEVGVMQTEAGNTYFIKDNGAGFDMTYYHKLFDVFQRFHRQDEFEGTGIGLAIVQKIVLKHGGQVWAESQVNQGSVFYFTLE